MYLLALATEICDEKFAYNVSGAPNDNAFGSGSEVHSPSNPSPALPRFAHAERIRQLGHYTEVQLIPCCC
jgi:hypothetical protein